MLFLYIAIILLLNILCRIREDINTIEKNILSNIPKLGLSLNINGTNGFMYNFEKINIYFKYEEIQSDNLNKIILINNPNIKILFNLSINEYCNDILDFTYKKDSLINDKIVVIDMNLKSITYFQQKSDFSFDVLFNIENLKNNISIHFDNLDELDIFKYLIYEEESNLYNNKTFVEYVKNLSLNNLINEQRKKLAYFPECDSLYYFNTLIGYILRRGNFFINYDCKEMNSHNFFNYAGVKKFSYDEIVKNDTHIILKSINCMMENQYDDEEDNLIETIKIDYITIDNNYNNYTINYGKTKNDDICILNAFKIVINKARARFDY